MSDPREQRKHARIESSISCSVATPNDAFEAEVTNLSKGGAAILGSATATKVGDVVTVMLERQDGLVTLALPGKVVRIEHRDEQTLYGVEFDVLPPAEEAELLTLLQLLSAGTGQGRRQHPRVSARVDVTCRTEDIFRGFLNDLSRGGLSVKTRRAVPIGKPMVISFGVPGLKGLVEVNGEVVSCRGADEAFRVGVKFAPLGDDDRDQVNHLLDVLLGITLPEGEVLPDDE